MSRAAAAVVRSRFAIASMVSAGALVLLWFFYVGPTRRDAEVKRSVVQVSTDGGHGTGFLVTGPDDSAYVATAFHVIDCGCPITIARAVEVAPDKHYSEAYTETEIAAYDADSDLAIIRLRNVKASTFGTLSLAKRPLKGTHIRSFGFPDRTVMRRQGLVTQTGDVLSMGKLPVVDGRTGEAIHDVDGVLISSPLEPGYSGGPTCDEHYDVIGINAIKDRTKMAHNGAIGVEALRRLVERIKPLEKRVKPTVAEVQELLARITGQYLRLAPDKRLTRREHEFIAITDLPKLRAFAAAVRNLDRDTTPSKATGGLSGRATLGFKFAAHPGSPLSTYRSEGVRQALESCEKMARGVSGFLDQFAIRMEGGDKDELRAACDKLAVRPLVWDLTATTLQWDDRPGNTLTVTQVDSVDDDEPVYRAQVTQSGSSTNFDVWVRWEGTDLRLKLVDKEGNLYGPSNTRPVSAESLSGSWSRPKRRLPFAEASIELHMEETLEVSSRANGQIDAHHVVRVTGRCPRDRVEGTLEQSFTGGLLLGGAALQRPVAPKLTASSFESCGVRFENLYTADIAVVIKRRGDRLVVHRSDGSEFPEEVELSRR